MDLPVCMPTLQTHHIRTVYLIYAYIQYWPWNFYMSTLPPSCHCMSFFLTLHTISLYLSISTILSTFLSSIDVFVSFSTTFTQVREDNGSLFLTLRSTRAANQPFTVHLNSRLLPPGDNTATGECTVCRRSRLNGSWLEWHRCTYVRV